jgi:hypothetical protein
MHWRNPNKPTHLKDPRPEPRDHETNTGNAGRDGYTVVARRPRVRGMTEPVDVERADRIENAFGTMPDDMGY